jgi:hypothetical protein
MLAEGRALIDAVYATQPNPGVINHMPAKAVVA